MDEVKKIPRRTSKQDRIDILLGQLDKWIKDGVTPYEAVSRLTEKQYDFLIDCDINLDDFVLTKEQQKVVKQVTKCKRPLFANGYDKKYPKEKQNLYFAICNNLQFLGATIAPKEKENYRDIDFMLGGEPYKLVLSKPRKKN